MSFKAFSSHVHPLPLASPAGAMLHVGGRRAVAYADQWDEVLRRWNEAGQRVGANQLAVLPGVEAMSVLAALFPLPFWCAAAEHFRGTATVVWLPWLTRSLFANFPPRICRLARWRL